MAEGPPRLFLKNLRPYTTTSQVSNALAEWNVSDGLVHVHCARRRFSKEGEPVTFFCTYTTQLQVLTAVQTLHQQFFLSDKMIIAAVAIPRKPDTSYPSQLTQATFTPPCSKGGQQFSPPTPAPWSRPIPPPPPPVVPKVPGPAVPKAPVQQDENCGLDHLLKTLSAGLSGEEIKEMEEMGDKKDSQEKPEDMKDDKIGGENEKDEKKTIEEEGEKIEETEGVLKENVTETAEEKPIEEQHEKKKKEKDVEEGKNEDRKEEKEDEENREVPTIEDGYGELVQVKEEKMDDEERGWNALAALANMPEDDSTSDYREEGEGRPDIDDDTRYPGK